MRKSTKLKKILLILIIILSTGCTSHKKNHTKVVKKIEIFYFYIEDCQSCYMTNKYCINVLKKDYSECITLKKYNLDDESIKNIYDEEISHLDKDVKNNHYGEAPLIIVKDNYALLGLGSDYFNDFVDDIYNLAHDNNEKTNFDSFKIKYIE